MRTDQCFTYWRLIGNLALKAVSLCRANDFQLNVFFKFIIMNLYLTSYINLVKVYLILNNNLCILQDLLDLFDTCLNISLLILCSIVLCILRQVTLLSGLFNLTRNFFFFLLPLNHAALLPVF